MKRKILIGCGIVLAVVLLMSIAVLVLRASSLVLGTGRILIANGETLLVSANSPIQLTNKSGNDALFAHLSDGDRVLVVHDAVAECYPGRTDAYALFKIGGGSIADIPDVVLEQLAELGWHTDRKIEVPAFVPDDFSFALTWNTYGISSYDSRTGALVKSTDATHPEEYVTKYVLPDEYVKQVYDLIRALDVNQYPEIYDPHEGMLSSPTMTLILTVRMNGKEKTIKAQNIALTYKTNNKKGQRFLSACQAIRDILIDSEEWKALPEYEFFYD